MKNLIVALTLFAASPVMAEGLCTDIEEIATAVHEARSAGVSVTRMMELANGSQVIETIVLDAYDRPRYQTEQVIIRDRQEFVNKWVMHCIRARR